MADSKHNRVLEYGYPVAAAGAWRGKLFGQQEFHHEPEQFSINASSLAIIRKASLDPVNNLYIADR